MLLQMLIFPPKKTFVNVARSFSRGNNLKLSISSVKTLIHNPMLLKLIFDKCGKAPNKLINKNDFEDLLYNSVARAS